MAKMDDMRAGAMYVARVLEIGAPENHLGWVKVTLLDRSLMSHPIWAGPAFIMNSFWMPSPGDLVFIFFEGGSWNDAFWFGLMYPTGGADLNNPIDRAHNEGYFKWQGDKWVFESLGPANERALDIATRGQSIKYGSTEMKVFGPPPNAISGYPNNHVIQTRAGHRLEFDDTPGRERITITGAPIKGSSHVIEVNSATDEISIVHSSTKFHMRIKPDGSMDLLTNDVNINTGDIEAKTGRVTLNAGASIRLEDTNGNVLETSKSGVKIKDKSGNTVTTSGGGVKIEDKSGSKVTMTGGNINVDSKGKVILKSGSRGVIREGDSSVPHIHVVVAPTGGGPCSVSPAIVRFQRGSQNVKAG